MSLAPHLSALRDRVAAIDVVDHAGGALSVLPSTGAVLGIQLCGRVRAPEGLLSTAGLTGIQSAARRYEYVGPTRSILVRFTPQGATCFGPPASALRGRSIALAELVGVALVAETETRVHEARDDRARIELVARLLLQLPFAPDPAIARALELLGSSPDRRDGGGVAHVARQLGMGERQLERRFLQHVGISPKRYASLRRFERAVALARTAKSLTRAALDAGYYDQSHFIRDFRRYTGAPPGAARADGMLPGGAGHAR